MFKTARQKLLLTLFIALGVGITAIDLWTKDAIFKLLEVETVGEPPQVIAQKRYTVIPRWFDLEATYNRGAFSGWFSQHTGVLVLVSGLALVAIAALFLFHLRRPPGPGVVLTAALGLVWGGTLGNLYDRYLDRAVRDWIKWYYVSADGVEHVWPNFNIADSAICVGVVLIIIHELFLARHAPQARGEEDRPQADDLESDAPRGRRGDAAK